MLASIHPPNGDPTKCCFQGASYYSDKDMREKIHQYNLKNPKNKVKDATKQDRLKIPPKQADIPDPKINHASQSDETNPSSNDSPDDSIFVEDYIYGNDPSDYIHMTEDPLYVEGQEEESDLHEPAINKNYIVADETDHDHDLPVPSVNQFICKPIIRASIINSSDSDPSYSDSNASDASMTLLKG